MEVLRAKVVKAGFEASGRELLLIKWHKQGKFSLVLQHDCYLLNNIFKAKSYVNKID